MDPLLSSLMRWASSKSFEARNKAKEQTNPASYQALSGHFFKKSLYTCKKLRNKMVPCMELSSSLGGSNQTQVHVCIPTYVECVTWSHTWSAVFVWERVSPHKIIGEIPNQSTSQQMKTAALWLLGYKVGLLLSWFVEECKHGAHPMCVILFDGGTVQQYRGEFSLFRSLIPMSPQYIARVFLYVRRKMTSKDLDCHIGAH